MSVATPTRLKQLREELDLSQEKLAHLAGITHMTYRNAEAGKNIQYKTATAILEALNRERQARQLPPVSMEDIGFGK